MPDDLRPARTRPSPERLAQIAAAVFDAPVRRIAAPGGRGRSSVRVIFDDRSVIATWRADSRRFATEVEVLRRLSEAGAPVPAWLGTAEGVMFQGDAGSARLSAQLTDPDRARAAARAALDSLWTLKRIAADIGLAGDLPALGMGEAWLSPFCAAPARLSRRLGLDAPRLDIPALADTLVRQPRHFVKWDARPGNAAPQPDGRVIWYDWEHAGRRAGPEDAAFLAGDEFWTLDADTTLELYARSDPQVTPGMMIYVTRFAVLQAVQRLALIARQARETGWTDPAGALRYDRIGADPDRVAALCARAADLSGRDRLLRPMVDWFARLPAALAAHVRRPAQVN